MRKKAILIRLMLVLSPFVLSSCIATRQDTLALSRQIQLLGSQISRLEGVRETQAEQGVEIDRLKHEIANLAGGVEENRRLAKQAIESSLPDMDPLDERLVGLEQRIRRLERALDLEPPQAPEKQSPPDKAPETGPAPSNSDAVQPQAEPVSENSLYEDTLALYREGKYSEAIPGFETLIQKNPESDLADNAQFWIGESYMKQGEFEQAIHAYQGVITKYPDGNKVPNAMLKQALAFLETQDTVAAKIVLKNLIKKFPQSEESKLAAAKLKQLN